MNMYKEKSTINLNGKKPKSKFSVVMLVDDNEVDNFINQKMIEGSNFAEHVYVHTSGKSALEFLHNLEKSASDIPADSLFFVRYR
ncbi:MAG: hypothetical protein IH948_06850 [Bacteroidetes bacterium]|nr:hypothetical protein [Bacteroidota bacterium]